MSRLTWDAVGERFYETGVDRAVLYVDGVDGVAWNGLVELIDNPSGAEPREFYFDGMKYYNARSPEELQGTINAYYSPSEFDVCDGSLSLAPGISATQQRRQSFGLCYRTKIGNDTDGEDHGYKLHLIYNASAAPTIRQNKSLGGDPTAGILSWSFTTKPVPIPGGRPGAHIVLDSTSLDRYVLSILEDVLYGTSSSPPRLPLPDEVLYMFNNSFRDGGSSSNTDPVVYDGGSSSTVATDTLDGGNA